MLKGPTGTQNFPRMTYLAKVLERSHGGPGAGALLTCPTCRLTKLDPHLFQVVLFGRLQMPLSPTLRSCRCGRLLDALGRAVRTVGVLGRRGFVLESVVARICRETGGRVNVLVRELDLVGVHAVDLEWSSTDCHCTQESSWPSHLWAFCLVGPGARSRCVVVGVEVGWMVCGNVWFRGRFGQGQIRAWWSWRLRWGSILSCTVARAVCCLFLVGGPSVMWC